MLPATDFRWTSAAVSHIGLVREINEDACLDAPERGVWAVADGMGGHTLGDFASRVVVEALSRLPAAAGLGDLTRQAREALQTVNRQLRREAAARAVQVIGTTVVALFARNRRCGYLWAGDSRLYLYRRGQLTRLTRDHSQVEELVSQGLLRPEEAADHPLRNLITRAVGADQFLELEEGALEVEDGDLLLLCSDGLTNEVDAGQMGAALASGNCRQAAEVLVDLALKHGGRDNVSVVVVRADDAHNSDRTVLNPAFL